MKKFHKSLYPNAKKSKKKNNNKMSTVLFREAQSFIINANRYLVAIA